MRFADRRTFLTAAATAAFAAGSFFSASATAAEPISVVATTGMIADVASEIGGDMVSVKALMGPGVDPHSYRQTRTDIVALAQADLVLWNGLYLEAQMEEFLNDLSDRTIVRALAETVAPESLVTHDDYEGRFDPHVWMDPTLWRDVVLATRDALTEVAPEHADDFATATTTYLTELEAVGTYAAEVLASVPENARVLISAHDAFNYFGEAYGFDVIGIQGISTESEAGLARIRDLVDMLVERDVRAVFVESSVSDRSVRALIEGAEARGHQVTIGGELYSDAMGAPGTYEGTYIGMIDHNATTIATALGGTAPERGLNDRLNAGS